MEIEHIGQVFRTNCRDQLEIFGRCVSVVERITEEKAGKERQGEGEEYSRLEEELAKWMVLYEENCILVDKMHKEQEGASSISILIIYEGMEIALATQT